MRTQTSNKIAIIGSICQDYNEIPLKNIDKNKGEIQTGGVLYYTGNALVSLGFDVTLFAMYGMGENPKGVKGNIIPIYAKATTIFHNKYCENNPDQRVQTAFIQKATSIRMAHLARHNFNDFQAIIYGPLLNHDIDTQVYKKLYNNIKNNPNTRIYLAAQGLIRYIKGDNTIEWKNPENVLNILPYIDYLLVDTTELEFITGIEKNIEKSVEVLKQKMAKNILITKASKGSMIFAENQLYNIDAFEPNPLVDTTGAGDSYLAGFIKGRELYPDNPQKQGEFAAMTATIAIENRGPFDAMTDDVKNRLKSNRIKSSP